MGTLVFHILLFSFFLLADVDMKGKAREDELLIEFPDILTEIEEEIPEQQEDDQPPMPNEASAQLSQTQSSRTNIASNRMAQGKEFFDEDYMSEVEAAKQLVAKVNNQLSKETVNLEDIKMPEKTTEGMTREEIENELYSGESNIVYYLENRYHLRLPIPVYLAQSGGLVVVDISVDRNGRVTQATPRSNPSIRDEQIYIYAKAAASRTVFNADPNAPNPQKGTIHYTFIAQ